MEYRLNVSLSRRLYNIDSIVILMSKKCSGYSVWKSKYVLNYSYVKSLMPHKALQLMKFYYPPVLLL